MKRMTSAAGLASKVAIGAAGLVVGAALAGTLAAQAAGSVVPVASPSAGSSEDLHPGDNGADGVPESQEHHGGGRGHDLPMSGTVTAVGSASVTVQTSSGTKTYSVTRSSDIDKNGEAALSDLAVGDAVTFSVTGANSDQIDRLHTGDEARNVPPAPAATETPDGTRGASGTSGTAYSA